MTNAEPYPDYMDSLFLPKEMNDAITRLREKKSPGPDKISNEMLKNLGEKARKKLLDLLNQSWKLGQVPQAWKDGNMIPIHKKGKSKKDVKSYRPICLTSCLGKLIESMINKRLMWHLEKNQLITPQQAGFRQHHSTEDQVTYLSQKIEDGFQGKKHTLAACCMG